MAMTRLCTGSAIKGRWSLNGTRSERRRRGRSDGPRSAGLKPELEKSKVSESQLAGKGPDRDHVGVASRRRGLQRGFEVGRCGIEVGSEGRRARRLNQSRDLKNKVAVVRAIKQSAIKGRWRCATGAGAKQSHRRRRGSGWRRDSQREKRKGERERVIPKPTLTLT